MKSYVLQSSFLSGVLDPRASARVETEVYANALLYGDNLRLHHLGGAKRRPGTLYRGTLPNKLYPQLALNVVTTPNGGTIASAYDDDESTLVTTTTPVSTIDPYVVVFYDFGAGISANVKVADVTGIISSAGSSTGFSIQYSADNVTWNVYGTPFETVDYQDTRSYRRESNITARYWRVAKSGGIDMGSALISISGFYLWLDTNDVSEVKLIPFEISTEDRYVVALTDRTATIYQNGAKVAAVSTPYDDEDIAAVDAATDAENMILVHEDYPPQILARETTTNFQRTPIVFDNVPTFDYNDASSPVPANDTHVITFAGTWNQGDTMQIELNGARSGAVVYAGDATADQRLATAANIAEGVQSLYTVKGYTGVSCVRTGSGEYTVVLGGDSADNYRVLSVTPVSGSGTATVAKTTTGTSRREPVWSATRGYPRTVAFFEGRLYFGGTKSRQQSVIGSTVNAVFDFEQSEGLDDEATFVTLRGQNLNAINGLYSGRALQLFTSGGEFRYVKQQGEPITPADAPVNQTQYGASKIRPAAIDGATLYVQRNGKSIRDFKYNYEEDAFDSIGVSALAPHLINDIVDLFVWNGSRTEEISLVFVINGDGTLAVLNSRREANVQAWVPWSTQGRFKAGAAVLEDVYFAVRRELNGVDVLLLEQMSDDVYTDSAVLSSTGPTTAATGLSHLNGATCRVRGDGFVLSDVMPSGGTATLERASSVIEVGLNYNTRLTPMPLQTVTTASAGSSNLMRRKRIVKVRAKVKDTLGLLMNGRVLEDRQLDIMDFDESAATPFTGNYEKEETTNWDQKRDLLVDFTQVDPLPMNILSIEVEMAGEE